MGTEDSGINNERRNQLVKKEQLVGEFLFKLEKYELDALQKVTLRIEQNINLRNAVLQRMAEGKRLKDKNVS